MDTTQNDTTTVCPHCGKAFTAEETEHKDKLESAGDMWEKFQQDNKRQIRELWWSGFATLVVVVALFATFLAGALRGDLENPFIWGAIACEVVVWAFVLDRLVHRAWRKNREHQEKLKADFKKCHPVDALILGF